MNRRELLKSGLAVAAAMIMPGITFAKNSMNSVIGSLYFDSNSNRIYELRETQLGDRWHLVSCGV